VGFFYFIGRTDNWLICLRPAHPFDKRIDEQLNFFGYALENAFAFQMV
jgi:hypothetical protein